MAKSPRCPVHDRGCSSAYKYEKCRCETCREWARAGRERRARARGVKPQKYVSPRCLVHNCSANYAYGYRGCRCGVCRPFMQDRQTEARRARGAPVAVRRWPDCPVHGCAATSAYRRGCRCRICLKCRADRYHSRIDKAKAEQKAYRDSHPEQMRAKEARRRGAVQGATPDSAKDQPLHRLYAAARLMGKVQGGEWHVDHIVPLARGGEHRWGNLQILDAKSNRTKGVKLESELDWTPRPAPLSLLLYMLDYPEVEPTREEVNEIFG